MSEVLHLPEPDCARALNMLPQFVDGDLAAEESAWLDGHLEACAHCREAVAGFSRVDSELTSWGRHLGWQNPAPAGAREQLASSLGVRMSPGRARRWMPVAVAALAAALGVVMIAPHGERTAVGREGADFIEIPYLPPLNPDENATIVRMKIRVATLIAAGYKVAADPDAIVPADVVVGEDGRAHAVRVLSDIGFTGTGR